MATSIDTNAAIVAFVREFVAKNNRGCPTDALRYVGNFSAKDIKAAKDAGMLSTALGAEGGCFVKGEELTPKKVTKGSSLKSRMAEILRLISQGAITNTAELAGTLVAEYDEECAKRTRNQ